VKSWRGYSHFSLPVATQCCQERHAAGSELRLVDILFAPVKKFSYYYDTLQYNLKEDFSSLNYKRESLLTKRKLHETFHPLMRLRRAFSSYSLNMPR